MEKFFKQKKGITLIALVITIIVLLILAGISISMLAGDNGILQKATDAKTLTGIGQEKEIISLAYNAALAKKVGNGNSSAVADSELNDELDSSEATASGNPIIVTFIKTGNAYEIDSNGIIKESTPKDPSVTLKVADKKTASGQAVTALSDTETTSLEDDLGNVVKVPKGFGLATDSGTKVEEGIVIEDVSHIDTKGSQFVWVPVGEITKADNTKITITLGRYTFDENGNETLVQEASKNDYTTEVAIESKYYEYGSSDSPGGNTTAKNLGGFINSAIDNGGYYIARYEAGINANLDQYSYANCSGDTNDLTYGDSTKIFAKDGTVKPLSIKGKGVWNAINLQEASIISRNMYSSDINSDLINSYTWDTAILFIQKCGNSNYVSVIDGSGTLKMTGNNSDEECKINDLSGNVSEWTTENSYYMGVGYVTRGGDYDKHNVSNVPFPGYNAAIRQSVTARNSNSYIGFRPILYL